MANSVQAFVMPSLMSLSDDDDSRLFEPLGSDLAQKILLIKHNNRGVTRLVLSRARLSERAWRRLRQIVGQSVTLKDLRVWDCDLDVAAFCEGLQKNGTIECLYFGVDMALQGIEKMNIMTPFLSNNPSLKHIHLEDCRLGSASINILSSALRSRTEDTIETLDLENNNFGDVDLDQLVRALAKCKKLRWLLLGGNGIGLKGCKSLAKLLENQEYLDMLHLGSNSINDEALMALTKALEMNRNLNTLYLHGNTNITTAGFSALLNLVCGSTIEEVNQSNHTLYNTGYLFVGRCMKVIVEASGVNNANLLRSCLRLNKTRDKMVVVRNKMIWRHASGDLNLGDSSIDEGVMPHILAWFGDDSNRSNLNQCHNPPLPKAEIDTIRLDSIYRILKTRPYLCKGSMDNKCPRGSTSIWFAIFGLMLSATYYLFSQISD